MALEHLKEYARRCATEDAVGRRAKAIGLTDIDGHIRHAKSLGLEWTRRDMVNFRNQVIDTDDELAQMSDEELELVAGGVCTTTAVVVGLVAAGAAAGAAVGGAAAAGAVGGAAAAGSSSKW